MCDNIQTESCSLQNIDRVPCFSSDLQSLYRPILQIWLFFSESMSVVFSFCKQTLPSFPLVKLGTFSSFQVTHAFQEELYKMRLICLKCCKVLMELCLNIINQFSILIPFTQYIKLMHKNQVKEFKTRLFVGDSFILES